MAQMAVDYDVTRFNIGENHKDAGGTGLQIEIVALDRRDRSITAEVVSPGRSAYEEGERIVLTPKPCSAHTWRDADKDVSLILVAQRGLGTRGLIWGSHTS